MTDLSLDFRIWALVVCLSVIALCGWLNWRYGIVIPGAAHHPILLRWAWLCTPCLYVAALVASVLFVPPASGDASGRYREQRAFLFVLLTTAPAIYFFFEAVWLYGQGHGTDEDYKHAQELGSRVWAAATLLLGFYWYSKAG